LALRNVINELKEIENKGKVLTIYLNTDRAECQSGSWKIKLKNGLKKLEEYIHLGSDDKEVKNFKKLKKKVEKIMNDSVTTLQKGVIIFASNVDKLFSVHFLQVPVETEFFWEDEPKLTQLEEIQRSYPTSGVVIANEDELILMHSELGELEVFAQFEFEAYTDDWRLFEGIAAADRTGSGANHRDAYQDRYEANKQRWIRNMIPAIEGVSKDNRWSHVHIIGQAEYLSLLENELNLKIKNVLRKTVSNIDQKQMINREVLAM
jgi:hypothetical protein